MIVRKNLRELLAWITIFIFTIIAASTELLGFFNIINHLTIKLLWLVVILISILIFIRSKKKQRYIFIKKEIKNFQSIFILLIILITFLISLIYPPNTLDAMSYHMTRIMHWIQNGNVDIYPTNDFRELIMGPLPEYVILHFYLLINGDNFSNLVQWYSMLVSCITVSLISKEFGCDSKFQIFSALFCATIPMGIMQSTSTQTDYIATMFLVIMAYTVIKYINTKLVKYIFLFSLSLGLGILTKGTVYIFGFSFCIWLGIHALFKDLKNFKYYLLIPVIVVAINIGQFSRNIIITNNPIGLNNKSNIYTNEIINFKTLTSNLIRNSGLNLALPKQSINLNITKKGIDLLHDKINISSRDTSTTTSGGYYIPFSFYESTAPNTLHFVIFLFIAYLLTFKQKLPQNHKYYFICIIFGYVFFSLIMKWAIQNNRHLLSFFVLCSPIVSYSLFKLKQLKLNKAIIICLMIYSAPYVFFNKSRPLIGELKFNKQSINFSKPFYLKQNREELYYIAHNFFSKKNLYKLHLQTVRKIAKANCDTIAIQNPEYNGMVYPFLALLIKEFESKAKDIKYINLNVTNNSFLKSDNEKKTKKVCAIVEFNNNMNLILL